MKKQLLLLFSLLSVLGSSAQSIGIIGTATPTQWTSDTDMTTTDNVNYTLTMTFTTGEAKFRQDDAWTINWGAASFPSGTGVQDGPNIPVTAGTYTVNFNRTTGAYSFTGSSAFPSIGIWGPAVDAINGFGGADVDMQTTDGITYTLSAFQFTSGNAKFRQDDNPTITWGGTSFPTGTAISNGPNVYIPGGQYTVTFNRTTGEYSFDFPSVGIIGSAVLGWDPNPDVDMTTTNGESYYLSNYPLVDGELKFRMDNSWNQNWGIGGINPNVLIPGGANIAIAAGNYDIYFNRSTLEYSITPSLGVNQAVSTTLSVYPNPAKNFWHISGGGTIENITVIDLSGKVILVLTPQANEVLLDATALQSGVYLAKVTTTTGIKNLRLIKN